MLQYLDENVTALLFLDVFVEPHHSNCVAMKTHVPQKFHCGFHCSAHLRSLMFFNVEKCSLIKTDSRCILKFEYINHANKN